MSAVGKVNILMVDDQPGKLLSYEAMLDELGENLIKANSGREALEILLRQEIAVVLMDVSMPELDGFELAEMIREHPRFHETAIIFISAIHLSDLDRIKGYERGAVDYVSVPIVPELLRAKVSVFADRYRKTRQLEALNADLQRLSNNLINAQDRERRRIARELHDGLGQELTAAKLLLNSTHLPNQSRENVSQATEEAATLIDRAIQQIRTMSHLLHPLLLEEVGLLPAIRSSLDGMTKRSGIEAALEVDPEDFPRLPAEIENAIFRIVQEALTNVFRHAEARHVWLRMCYDGAVISVVVRDDGKGLGENIDRLLTANHGIGLGGMKQRVKELGGELLLRNSSPGTIVEVLLPVETGGHQALRSDQLRSVATSRIPS
jgi:signal transduction histidine kinase